MLKEWASFLHLDAYAEHLLTQFQENPLHFLIETGLIVLIIVILLQKSYKSSSQAEKLTEKV